MSVITYAAKRDIITGHVVNTSYSMQVSDKAINHSYQENKVTNTSIGGVSEYIFRNEIEFYNVTFGSFPRISGIDTLEQIREFYASVRSGEVFTFDPYGTISVPDNVINVTMDTKNYSPVRIGGLDRYNISFKFRVVV